MVDLSAAGRGLRNLWALSLGGGIAPRHRTDSIAIATGDHRTVRRYADDVAAASWDSVIFDLPDRPALQRVPTLDPLRGTRAHVGDILDRAPSAADLVRMLTTGN